MIAVLRLGHRIARDKRITTHVALVARAFGAQKIFITTKDNQIKQTIQSTCERFGGTFRVETGINAKKLLKQWNGTIVHLTMYGDILSTAINAINKEDDILIIVGAEKVPAQIYEAADFNVAVGNQPHSEVAALALFLDRLTDGAWQSHRFNGKLEIVPSPIGKNVISKN